MSTRPEPQLDVEQEVDLGRYWSALVARWWLVLLGLVIGALIGILASTGGGRGYQSEAVVYLGQPFAPGGTDPRQNLPTRLATVGETVQSRAVVKKIADELGLRPARLRSNISTEPVAGIASGRFEQPSPLVSIKVKSSSARIANRAADMLADVVVRGFSTFVDEKLAVYKARRNRAERELSTVGARIESATQEQTALRADRSLQPIEKLVLLANLNNVLQFNESRQTNLEGTLLTLRTLIAQANQVERARLVEPAAATREAGPSKRTGAIVGALIGLIVGVLGALLWEPLAARVKRRPAAV